MESKVSAMLFAGSSYRELGKNLAKVMGLPFGNLLISHFPDGECKVEIQEKQLPKTAFLFQTLATFPQEYTMETLFILDALRREGVEKIHLIAPYLAYARQDRKAHKGVPIAARILADVLEQQGIASLTTFNLHSPQIEGFFRVPVLNLDPTPLFALHIPFKPSLIVAPDIGSIKIAKAFSTQFKVPYAVIDKERNNGIHMTFLDETLEEGALNHVLLVDDLCSTGLTLQKASFLLKEKGALKISVAVSHFLNKKEAFSQLEKAPIETIWTLNSLIHTLPDSFKIPFQEIDISSFLEKNLSSLF